MSVDRGPNGHSRLSLEHIAEAAEVMDPVFRNTPQFSSPSLNDLLGLDVTLKVETLNPIRSFKGRGTQYFVHRLGAEVTHLTCASAGNFGQGLAYAASRRGLPLDVFAATTANALKVEAMRRLGATVHLEGFDFDEAKEVSRVTAEARGWTYVEDGREPAIAEGAGTIGLELCRVSPAFDALYVPVGNGALINGIGRWCKAHSPGTRIVGVCAAGAPAMQKSWQRGSPLARPSTGTIADGIDVRVPLPVALDEMAATVDEVVLVDDETIISAMQLLFQHLGLVVEPAGAAGFAAVLAERERLANSRIATPLCGGNVTADGIRRWLTGDVSRK